MTSDFIKDNLMAIFILWYRDVKRYWNDKIRMLGSLGQPILFLFVLGTGLSPSVQGITEGSFVTFLYPGIMGLAVLFPSVFSGISIIWDREFGFLREVLVAPCSRGAIAIGKTLGGASIGTIQGIILLVLAPIAGVPLTLGMIVRVVPILFLLAVALASVGIVCAARMKSMEGFQMIMNFVVMPIFFLSGALFPLKGVPPWLGVLTHLDPLTYGVDALRWAVLAEHQFPLVLDLGIISAFSAILMIVGAIQLSRSD